MRIDPSHLRVPIERPLPAAGNVAPQDELLQAVDHLQRQGYAMEVLKGGLWILRDPSWKAVQPEECLDALHQQREVRAADRLGNVVMLHSQEDLLELAACRPSPDLPARRTDRLASPVLVGALLTLEKEGQLFCRKSGELPSQCSSFEGYNALTGDRAHSFTDLEFRRSWLRIPVDSQEKALELAYLLGFGDPARVSEPVRRLVELARDRLVGDPLEVFHTGSGEAVREGTRLGRFKVADLTRPETVQSLQEARDDHQALRAALTADQAAQAYAAAHELRKVAPVAEQADLLKEAASALPLREAVRFHQGVLQSLAPREELATVRQAARQALAVGGDADRALRVFARLKAYPDQETVLMLALHNGLDVPDAVRLASTVPTEQVELLQDLHGALHLALEAANRGRLGEDRERLLRLASGPDAVARYRMLVERIPPEQAGLYFDFLELEPAAAHLNDLWQAIASPPESADRRMAVIRSLAKPLPPPLHSRVELAAALPDFAPEDLPTRAVQRLTDANLQRSAVLTLTRTVLERLTPGQDPEELLELAERTARLGGQREVFLHLSELNEGQRRAYEAALTMKASPEDANTLASSLSEEQGHLVRNNADELLACQFKPETVLNLLHESLRRDRLERDHLLFTRLDPKSALQVYTVMADQVQDRHRLTFLELARQEIPPKELAAVWGAIALDEDRVEQRTGAFSELRRLLPKEPLASVVEALGCLPAGSDPTARLQALRRLQEKVEGKELLPAFRRVLASRDPEVTCRLVDMGATLAQSLQLTQWISRPTFPGVELPAEERCGLLSRLASLRQGNLEEAMEDYLFLAGRVQDPEAIPDAVDFFARLREAGLDSRDARLAVTDLARRDDPGEAAEAFLEVARCTGSYSASRPVWDQLEARPGGEVRLRELEA
ncbi:MAG: hypothetical protein AB1758_18650, partial [Candidatus Eremiobacterota bacterium]